MTADAKPRIKITYATLKADNEDLHTGFEEAVTRVRAGFGGQYRQYIDGAWRDGDGTFEVRSPIDTDLVLGHCALGTTADVDAAYGVGAGGMPLRADDGAPYPLARERDAFAPALQDGFFVVPRLASHRDVGAPTDIDDDDVEPGA